MTAPLDTADRRLLLVSAGVLVVLTLAAVLLPSGHEEASVGFPSSYSTAYDGAKAAYLLLGEMGYHVERWMQPPGDLPAPSRGTILIIAGPTQPASPEEQRQLRDFVAQGGRLLLTGMLSTDLIGAQGVEVASTDLDQWQMFAAEQPAPLTLRVPEITMRSDVRWVHPFAGLVRYYGDRQGATVAKLPIGEGEAIWWAGDSPLTNSGLSRASNLELFLNSVGPPGQTRVLWDEYFHGARLGLGHYLARTPLPWAFLQLLLLAGFIILTFGRRSGPIRPLSGPSRLSPLEFVATLGGIYERRGEAAGALEIAYTHFRFLLVRRLGVAPSAATADLIRSVRNRPGWNITGFAETVAEIEAALKTQDVAEPRALALIGALHDFTIRLGLEGGGRT